jgi:hypothetical protein
MRLLTLEGNNKLWEDLAKTVAAECDNVIRSWPGYDNFILSKLDLNWSSRRTASRGGLYAEGPGISIAMNVACMIRTRPYRIYEYKSFDTDPVIGGFYGTNPWLPLGLHICHEMAHAAQFYAHFNLGIISDRPHGTQFKNNYAKIRKVVLNKHIPPNQQQLKEEYLKIIEDTIRGVYI